MQAITPLFWFDNQAVVERVTACFMKMTKFNIAELEAAAK
jgi:hypothetical protein